MYNAETIVERTCDLIVTMAKYAEGRLGRKPKVGVLYRQRDSLKWWIIRFITNFSSVSEHWYIMTDSAIRKAAHTYGINTYTLPLDKESTK